MSSINLIKLCTVDCVSSVPSINTVTLKFFYLKILPIHGLNLRQLGLEVSMLTTVLYCPLLKSFFPLKARKMQFLSFRFLLKENESLNPRSCTFSINLRPLWDNFSKSTRGSNFRSKVKKNFIWKLFHWEEKANRNYTDIPSFILTYRSSVQSQTDCWWLTETFNWL